MFDDSEFIKKSREAAEDYELPHDTQTWDKIEQTLNIQLPQQKKKRRFIFWWIPILFGTGLLLWWGGSIVSKNSRSVAINNKTGNQQTFNNNISKSTKKAPSVQLENQSASIEINEASDISDKQQFGTQNLLKDETSNEQSPALDAQIMPIEGALENNKLILEKNKKYNNYKAEKSKINTEEEAALLTYNNAIVNKKNNQSNTGLLVDTFNNKPPFFKEAINEDAYGKSLTYMVLDNTNASPINLNQLVSDSISATHLFKLNDISDSIKGTHASIPALNKTAQQHGFVFGILAGTDISTVKMYQMAKPGLSVGLTFAYRLHSKWELQTGLLYTQKNYTAKGTDYQPKAHYWTYYVDLTEVTGSCNMWELPINLRYNFSTTKTTNWFATTGVSSYFMKKEDYDYYYYYNGQYKERNVVHDSSSNYWMGVLNFSGGMEKKLNSNFSIQAEPYLRIPLKELGFGNLSLNSLGVYVSLRYQPQHKSKKR